MTWRGGNPEVDDQASNNAERQHEISEWVGASETKQGRKGILITWAVIITAVNVGLWWIGSTVTTPEQRAAEAAPPTPSPIAVPVETGPIMEVLVTRGDVKPLDPFELKWSGEAPPDGLAVVTGLPVSAGDVLEDGQVVAEVAARPIFLLSGPIPMYRDLKPNATGEDVRQLQTGLQRLGFYAGTVDGRIGSETIQAIGKWYESAGYQTLNVLERSSGIVVPLGEIVYVPEVPVGVASVSIAVGDIAPGVLMTLSDDELVVELSLDSAALQVVTTGANVNLFDEISGLEATGSVASVEEVSDLNDVGVASDGYRATVVTDGQIPAEWMGRNVRVTIEISTLAPAGLVVPEAAVFAGVDGSMFVTLYNEADNTRESVLVEIVGTSSGRAAVKPLDPVALSAGDLVIVGFTPVGGAAP